MSRVRLYRGNCLDILRGKPENSYDAVVTDPPYGLGSEPDAAEVLRHWLAGDDYRHQGGGFMGKSWDSFVPGPVVWREVFRVLKPGGYALVFAGTRTHGLMEMALRLAGFEIRDSLDWIYGSGFPKSLDVSKALDKAAGAIRRETVDARERTQCPYLRRSESCRCGENAADGRSTAGATVHQIATESATDAAKRWAGWGTALKPAHEPIIVARKPLIGTVAENVLRYGTGALNIDGCRVGDFKPELHCPDLLRGEPCRCADNGADGRSTSGGTVHVLPSTATGRWPPNVLLTHSPACTRAGTREVAADGHWPASRPAGSEVAGPSGHAGQEDLDERSAKGETVEAWDCAPGCPVAALDAQSGTLRSGDHKASHKIAGGTQIGTFVIRERTGDDKFNRDGDTGGASRFFPVLNYGEDDFDPDGVPFLYCAKASRSEREAGCEDLPARSGAEAVDREEGSAGTKSPRAGAGRTALQVRNLHPTVKPVALMRWLVRLVTRGQGVVLDPYAGSGTSLVASVLEGASADGIEIDRDNAGESAGYLAISEARVRHAAKGRDVSIEIVDGRPMDELESRSPAVPHALTAPELSMSTSDRPYVTRVRSNLQGGVDVALDRHTLLLGPSESGKDAVIRSIELALRGRVRDFVFREGATKAGDLMALAPGRKGHLWAEVELSDGRKARWETTGGDGHAKDPDWRPLPDVDPESIFPLHAVRDAIKGNPDTARKFVIQRVVGQLTTADVLKRIAKPLHARYLSARGAETSDPLADLLRASTTATQRRTEASKSAAGKQAILDGQEQLPPMPEESDVARAAADVREAATTLETAVKRAAELQGARAARQRLAAERERAAVAAANVAESIEKATTSVATWTAHRAALPAPEPVEPSRRVENAQELLRLLERQEAAIGRGSCACSLCGSSVDLDAFSARVIEIREAIDAAIFTETSKAQERASMNAARAKAIAEADTAIASWTRKLGELRAVQRAMATQPATEPLDEIEAGPSPEAIERLRLDLAGKLATKSTIDAAAAQWEALRSARDGIVLAKEEVAQWSALLDATKWTVRELLDGAIEKFCKRVQKFLASDLHFDLRVREGDRDVFQFGLVRNADGDNVPRGTPGAVLHTVLSGGAGQDVLLALGQALLPDTPQLAIFVNDDRDMDPIRRREMAAALVKSPCQILLTSCTKLGGGKVKGLRIVDLPPTTSPNIESPIDDVATPEVVTPSQAQANADQAAFAAQNPDPYPVDEVVDEGLDEAPLPERLELVDGDGDVPDEVFVLE